MATKHIYISAEDEAYWNEAMGLAKAHKTSISKVIMGELKTLVRERRKGVGVPLGVPVPAAMKDPESIRRDEIVSRVVAVLKEELESS